MRDCDLRKVTIIGAGNVGATIAYTLAIESIANEIVIIDCIIFWPGGLLTF